MCHGSNWYGLLGRGQVDYPYDFTPQPIAWTRGKITELFAVGNAFCGKIAKNGGLVCWGENSNGELGRGYKSYGDGSPDYFAPAHGMDVKNVNWIYHGICVLSHDGALACAGDLNDCELEGMSKLPAKGITGFSASYSSSCALIDKGVKCWGWKDGEGLVCTPWDVTFPSPIVVDPVPPPVLWLPTIGQ